MSAIPPICIRLAKQRLASAWRYGLWEQRTAKKSYTRDLFTIPCKLWEAASRFISSTAEQGWRPAKANHSRDYRSQALIENSAGPVPESKEKTSWFQVLM